MRNIVDQTPSAGERWDVKCRGASQGAVRKDEEKKKREKKK